MDTSNILFLLLTICAIQQTTTSSEYQGNLHTCDDIPSRNWCTNRQIATLCNVLEACEDFWTMHGIVPTPFPPTDPPETKSPIYGVVTYIKKSREIQPQNFS
ncbi:uncharacterized protein [Fopius arisanus]|uniref:ANO2 protein n=1 Tax=Fopius arisanus TaxID=64838 RepID=A0A0C9RK03_9HYME|nr:PREDICTED: uncharacterized protein LOC105268090 [Fopius arisanus]